MLRVQFLQLMPSLKLNVEKPNFYLDNFVFVILKVLLNSILPEWFRIGQMLKRLLCDYFIQRKIHVFKGRSLVSMVSTFQQP